VPWQGGTLESNAKGEESPENIFSGTKSKRAFAQVSKWNFSSERFNGGRGRAMIAYHGKVLKNFGPSRMCFHITNNHLSRGTMAHR